jgi:hypothetical protein
LGRSHRCVGSACHQVRRSAELARANADKQRDASALAGKPVEAEKAMARLRQIDPELRLSNLKDLFPIRRSEDFDRWAEGLRKAGLPE